MFFRKKMERTAAWATVLPGHSIQVPEIFDSEDQGVTRATVMGDKTGEVFAEFTWLDVFCPQQDVVEDPMAQVVVRPITICVAEARAWTEMLTWVWVPLPTSPMEL